MAKIYYYNFKKDNLKGKEVDGQKVSEYVYSKISFTLPQEIYSKIDDIFYNIWMNSKNYINSNYCISEIIKAKKEGFILSDDRIKEIVKYVFEYLEKENYVKKS